MDEFKVVSQLKGEGVGLLLEGFEELPVSHSVDATMSVSSDFH